MIERIRRHLGRHGEWWWAPVFYALVVLWIYRDLWHQNGGATGFGWDVVDTHAPDLEYMARELRAGHFALWNPYDKGGYPVYADPIVCRYYPFAWPFVAWGALFGTSWWLMQVEVLAHHVALACCMHLFLRTRGLSVRAAMLGGVGLVGSAPLIIHKASNVLWPLVWVPLVWIALDAAIAKPSWRRGIAIAAAFTLCATAGSPPGLFYAGLLIAPYAIWRLVPARRDWRRLVPCFAIGGVVAGLVVALTTIPTQTLVALGSREKLFASGADFALSLSLPWPDAWRSTFVHGAGLPEMYLGATIAVLAAVALVQRFRDTWLFVAIAVIGVVLAAGASLWTLPWLVYHVPGFALLRVPGRYKLLAAWTAVVAAAFGLDALRDPRRWPVIAAVVAIAATSIDIIAVHRGTPQRPAWWSVIAIAAPAAAAIGAVLVPRLRRWVAPVLVVAVLFDASQFTITPESPPASDPRRLHEGEDEVLAKLDGITDRYRLYDEFLLGERVGQRRGVRDFRGYPAVDPLSQVRYFDVLTFAHTDPAILTDFNVRWLLRAGHFRFSTQTSFVTRVPPEFVSRDTDRIYEALHPAPLVAWYGRVQLVTDATRVLPAMRAVQRPDGERTAAIVEPYDAMRLPFPHLASGAPRSIAGTLVAYGADEIETAIDAPADGLVVLNELWFPGWEVFVDGERASLVRANYLLRAVYVTAGHHAITWRFAPPHVHALLDGYLLALLAMLVAAAWPRARADRRDRRRRRSSRPAAPARSSSP